MQLKIIEVNTPSAAATEEAVNTWLENKEFQHLEIANITEYQGQRVGSKIYILYELAEQYANADEE